MCTSATVSKRDYHTDGFRGHKFYEPTDATDNIVTVRLNPAASDLLSVTPGLLPQDVKPVQISETHTPRPAQHFHDYNESFRGKNFRRETDAARWIYDRVVLAQSRKTCRPVSPQNPIAVTCGTAFPAYTAQAKVEVAIGPLTGPGLWRSLPKRFPHPDGHEEAR